MAFARRSPELAKTVTGRLHARITPCLMPTEVPNLAKTDRLHARFTPGLMPAEVPNEQLVWYGRDKIM